jgi:hypothetical protein
MLERIDVLELGKHKIKTFQWGDNLNFIWKLAKNYLTIIYSMTLYAYKLSEKVNFLRL